MKKQINHRSELIDAVNQKKIFISYGDELLEAKVAGAKMQYPVIYSPEYRHFHAEISWELVGRLYTGEITSVTL